MKKIRKLIKSKEDFDNMMKILSERITDNTPISSNPMLDGFIIGFIFSTYDFTLDLFLNKNMGHVLDGTLQKLEHITKWVINNENELCQIIKDIKMCDMCGNSFLGESFKVVDENFNLQRGLIQCGKCLVGEEN